MINYMIFIEIKILFLNRGKITFPIIISDKDLTVSLRDL